MLRSAHIMYLCVFYKSPKKRATFSVYGSIKQTVCVYNAVRSKSLNIIHLTCSLWSINTNMKLARNENYVCCITRYDTIMTQTGTNISYMTLWQNGQPSSEQRLLDKKRIICKWLKYISQSQNSNWAIPLVCKDLWMLFEISTNWTFSIKILVRMLWFCGCERKGVLGIKCSQLIWKRPRLRYLFLLSTETDRQASVRVPCVSWTHNWLVQITMFLLKQHKISNFL